MKSMHLPCAFALLVFTSSAAAEVRLETHAFGASRVTVRPTVQGPWTSAWPADPRVLNAGGDALGDSHPVIDVDRDRAYVSWLSPERGGVAVAASSRGHWLEAAVPAPTTGVRFDLHRVENGAVLLWTESLPSGSHRLSLASVGVDADADRVIVSEPATETGLRTLGAIARGQSLHVVSVDADGVLWDGIWLIPDPPISPIKRAALRLGTIDDPSLVDPAWAVAPSPRSDRSWDAIAEDDGAPWDEIIPISHVPGQPIGPFERMSISIAVLHLSSAVELGGRFAAEVGWPFESQSALRRDAAAADVLVLTWWSAPRELSFVELDEDGPALPVATLTAERGPERPQRLVQEAVRIVRDRY